MGQAGTFLQSSCATAASPPRRVLRKYDTRSNGRPIPRVLRPPQLSPLPPPSLLLALPRAFVKVDIDTGLCISSWCHHLLSPIPGPFLPVRTSLSLLASNRGQLPGLLCAQSASSQRGSWLRAGLVGPRRTGISPLSPKSLLPFPTRLNQRLYPPSLPPTLAQTRG